jgi:hypothetical protein
MMRLIRLGALKDIHDKDGGGLGTFNRAMDLIRDTDGLTGEVDKMLLKVATLQNSQPSRLLTNDEIVKHLQGGSNIAAPRSYIEKMGAVRNTLRKIRDTHAEFNESPAAKQALQFAEVVVEQAGGTAADKAQIERERQKQERAKERRLKKRK